MTVVSPRLLASLLPGVLASFVAPTLAYALIRPHVASSAAALLAAMAIPAGWTLVTFAVRRRASPLGLLSVARLGVALAVSYLTGGSALALELHDPAETGAAGLAASCRSSRAGRCTWRRCAWRPAATPGPRACWPTPPSGADR